MSDESEKKSKSKSKPKTEVREPVVFLVYTGELSQVALYTSANDAMDAITEDRERKVERVILKRSKRRARS
jgi:hypothetical protein